MKIIEYNTLKDIHMAINHCELKHSDIWNTGNSFSFRTYDKAGNTIELHIFKYRSEMHKSFFLRLHITDNWYANPAHLRAVDLSTSCKGNAGG